MDSSSTHMRAEERPMAPPSPPCAESGQQHCLANFDSEELRNQDICSTPKKMPAQETKALQEMVTTGSSQDDGDDSYYLDFWERIKHAQQASLRDSERLSSRAMSILPEYARYQDHKLQRVLSRGNSLKNLTMTPRSPGNRQSQSPPRVEWVVDKSSSSSSGRSSKRRSWDEEALIARHAFPTSIFCKRSDADCASDTTVQEGNYPYRNFSTSDLSDGVSSFGAAPNRPDSFRDGSASIPSVAALSGGSGSTWSEEEPMGVREFLAFLERNPSFAKRTRRPLRSAAPQTTKQNASMVEISPGVREPLRRADETIHAVRNDFYVPVACFSCSLDIFCIADAKYVVCPSCKVVSPIEDGALDGQKLVQHGLGLGFTCESLFQIQADILNER